MSEFSSPPSSTTHKKTPHHHFSSLLSDFHLFCSFLLSHPLYFSYFLFFFPYLLKLLSFLSPLFLTTFLLLLVIYLTFSPSLVHETSLASEPSDSTKPGFVFATYQALVARLRYRVDDINHVSEEFQSLVVLQVYNIVFDVGDQIQNPAENAEAQVQKSSTRHDQGSVVSEVVNGSEFSDESCANVIAEGIMTLASFLHQKEEFEEVSSTHHHHEGEKEVEPQSVKSNKVEEEQKEDSSTLRRSGSKAILGHKTTATKAKASADDCVNSQRSETNLWSVHDLGGGGGAYGTCNSEMSLSGPNLGSYGSMRKEKEWRRTLACKLFEERHNADNNGGGEGMDLLWETYETDSISKVKTKCKSKKGKKKGSSKIEHHYDEEDDDEGEEEEEENSDDGQLCCLQALKFSAGKMNLGMGRPNLVKISKALKGIGWLHHVTRHGKKGCH